MKRPQVYRGDITKLTCDAIVNAANSALSGGGGVDGAIHKAAGPELLAACRKLGRCATGCAVITPGFELPAKYVIHTVGPVWDGGEKGEAYKLASCYRECIRIAVEEGVQSIAFPAISCGVYRFPINEAAKIAVATVIDELKNHHTDIDVIFVCFDDKSERAISTAIAELD